ncbi:hypothetical protein ACFQ0B_65250 [Nonomuraea thailandensis]
MDNLPAANRAAADPDDMEAFIKLAKAQYRVQWDKKADLGSRVHAIGEAINLGKAYIPDEEAEPFVESYRQFLADFGVDLRRDIMTAECTVLNRTIPYGGTSDIWARLRFPARRRRLRRSSSRARSQQTRSRPRPGCGSSI